MLDFWTSDTVFKPIFTDMDSSPTTASQTGKHCVSLTKSPVFGLSPSSKLLTKHDVMEAVVWLQNYTINKIQKNCQSVIYHHQTPVKLSFCVLFSSHTHKVLPIFSKNGSPRHARYVCTSWSSDLNACPTLVIIPLDRTVHWFLYTIMASDYGYTHSPVQLSMTDIFVSNCVHVHNSSTNQKQQQQQQ